MITHGGRLPAETTRFFGRAEEAASVRGALGRSRLVTLTGPGGVGKTRIAVRVARDQSAAFPDGVCMVQLSGLRDPELLPGTIAAALGQGGPPGETSIASLVDYLRGKRMLIILDTCEHLIDACAMLVDVLLRGADGPRLLATSRQALDIPGEVVYPIPPLAVPDDGGDAVALFADRVAAAVPWFTITDEVLPDVVRLCRALDGLPLAIELAAVRLRAVGLDELLARMGDRLRLLAGGSRRVTRRHQTLRMTIGWSYELCSETEQLLWTRLSAFTGEFGLEAAETVCAGGALDAGDILDTLIGLVDKSIVLRADDADGPDGARYRLLDVIREFGAELLEDADVYRERHLEYHLGLARAFEPSFLGPEQGPWIDRLTRDYANIEVALESCVTDGRAADGLDFATACWGFWMATGRVREGSGWLHRLLNEAPEPSPQRVRGLWLASWFASAQGRNAESARLRAQAREIAAGLPGPPELPPSAGPPAEVLRGLRAVMSGHYDEGAAACDDVLRGLPGGETWVRGTALWVKGLALWFSRDPDGFVSCQRESIRLKRGFGDLISLAHLLEGFAWLAADQAAEADASPAGGSSTSDAAEHCVRVARLHGAADRMWRSAADEPRYGLHPLNAERARAERLARETLGDSGYAREHEAGAAMNPDEAARYALGEAERSPVPQQATRPAAAAGTEPGKLAAQEPWELLTAREREVATLVADGLTNKDIAARLVVSKRTVDAHVEHILGKLGYSSRVQVAALASAQQPKGGMPVPPQRAAESGNLAARRCDRE